MATSCVLRWRLRRFLFTPSVSVMREMESDVVIMSMRGRLAIRVSLLVEASWRLPNKSITIL